MMKHLLFIMVLGLLGFNSMAQELPKNNIYASYGWVTGDVYSGGDFSGNGFVLGYSRYITDRIYGDISYGKTDFEGRNNIFFLDPEEMGLFNMTEFSLGGGYDLFQSEDFLLSGELSYLRIAHESLISQIGSGDDIDLRVTGRIHDQTVRAGIKGRFFINEHLQFIPSAAYGFQIQRYGTLWLNAGFGYAF